MLINMFRKNKKAFTLVELIVVIAIIAVLATAAGIGVSRWVDTSRKNTCETNAATLKTALETAIATGTETTTIQNYLKEVAADLGTVYYNQKAGSTTIKDLKGQSTDIAFAVKTGKYWCVVTIKATTSAVVKAAEAVDTAPSGFADNKTISLA